MKNDFFEGERGARSERRARREGGGRERGGNYLLLPLNIP
jgi:hypothetical protein